MKRQLAFAIAVAAVLLPAHTTPASEAGKARAEAERQLHKAYDALLSSMKLAEKTKLQTAQRAWLQYRAAEVELFALRYRFSKGGLFYETKLTQARTKYLETLLKHPPTVEDVGPMEYQN